MMTAWHQLVPISGHVEESETARKLQLYATSIKTSVSTRLPLYIPGSIKTHRIYTRDFIYPARITMKLYDMIQVYSSGSTVIMHMHYI